MSHTKETSSTYIKLFINGNMSWFSMSGFDFYSYFPKNTFNCLKEYFWKNIASPKQKFKFTDNQYEHWNGELVYCFSLRAVLSDYAGS